MKNRVNWLQSLLTWLDPRQLLLVLIVAAVGFKWWDIWGLVKKLVITSKTKKIRDIPG